MPSASVLAPLDVGYHHRFSLPAFVDDVVRQPDDAFRIGVKRSFVDGLNDACSNDGDDESSITSAASSSSSGSSEQADDGQGRGVRGHVCSLSLYRVWMDREGRTEGRLNALCSVLFRRRSDGGYSVEYALVDFLASDVADGGCWNLGADMTAAKIAAVANEASRPDRWPSSDSAGGHERKLWKAVYCAAAAAARAKLGYGGYYRPCVLLVDEQTGLVASLRTDGERASAEPNLAIVRTEGTVTLNPKDVSNVAARFSPEDDAAVTCAFLRTTALRETRRVTDREAGRCRLDIVTKSPGASAAKRCRDERPFDVVDKRVLLPRVPGGPITLTSLVPRGFDCLVTTRSDYSPVAAMAAYAAWFADIHHDRTRNPCRGSGCAYVSTSADKRLPPIFSYVGPETAPGGEPREYSFWPGFPGWQILRVGAPDKDSVAEAASAYALTDGLWPMAGPVTFWTLRPREREGATRNTSDAVAALRSVTVGGRALEEYAEQWPAGRIKCAFSECAVMRSTFAAKFDFSAFFPTLHAALRPEHRRLTEALALRLDGRARWLKRPLVEYCGMLKKVDPETYEALVLLGNGVAETVEMTAEKMSFAVCAYVKDGFWGAFVTDEDEEGEEEEEEKDEEDETDGHGCCEADRGSAEQKESLARERARTKTEELRAACEAAANAFVADVAGAPFPPDTRLRLRTEGTFRGAVSWHSGCYFLRGDAPEVEHDFVGFPTGNEFSAAAKRALVALLAWFVGEPTASPSELTARADATCVRLVELAFSRRADADFWKSLASGPAKDAHENGGTRAALLANSSTADRGAVEGHTMKIVTADGRVATLPTSEFAAPVAVPAVACEECAAATFAAIKKLIDAVAAACVEHEEPPTGPELDESDEERHGEAAAPPDPPATTAFDLSAYSFLFIKNR